uniref:Uncharacterized protein n=1 Tax=Romanomermis culicivorax TaxID=13658 RepID=A0A915JZF7_ROMCU
MDIMGYTEEKDVYNCVVACFIRDSLGGCNYVPVLKRCYFQNSRQPCSGSRKCIQVGYYESVHIYFTKTLI